MSLAAGTLLHSLLTSREEGLKPIQDIKVGDYVFLTKNQYIYGCPKSGVYDKINRKWPATPAACDKLYQQAQPLMRKETMYNLTLYALSMLPISIGNIGAFETK